MKCMDLANILATYNIGKIKFYYRKSKLLGNIFTACLLVENNNTLVARGISICSVKDTHNKKIARNLAFGRAIKALKKKSTGSPINDDIEDRKNLYGSVTRIYKKTNKNEKEFNELKAEVEKFDLYFEEKNDGNLILVCIPIYYPIERTSDEFRYKYEYKPILTEEELKIIGNKKE